MGGGCGPVEKVFLLDLLLMLFNFLDGIPSSESSGKWDISSSFFFVDVVRGYDEDGFVLGFFEDDFAGYYCECHCAVCLMVNDGSLIRDIARFGVLRCFLLF